MVGVVSFASLIREAAFAGTVATGLILGYQYYYRTVTMGSIKTYYLKYDTPISNVNQMELANGKILGITSSFNDEPTRTPAVNYGIGSPIIH